MKQTEQSIRLHTFNETVAISTPNTDQLYLTPADALALATELRRFAKGCKKNLWYSTRTVENGKTTNDFDGSTKPKLIWKTIWQGRQSLRDSGEFRNNQPQKTMINSIEINTTIPCPSGSGIDLDVTAKGNIGDNSPISAFTVDDVEIFEASHKIKFIDACLPTSTIRQIEDELIEAAHRSFSEIASRIDSQNKADQRFYIEAWFFLLFCFIKDLRFNRLGIFSFKYKRKIN